MRSVSVNSQTQVSPQASKFSKRSRVGSDNVLKRNAGSPFSLIFILRVLYTDIRICVNAERSALNVGVVFQHLAKGGAATAASPREPAAGQGFSPAKLERHGDRWRHLVRIIL